VRITADPSRFRQAWVLFAALCGAGAALPLALLFGSWLFPQTEIWSHLRETLLTEMLLKSLVLAVGTGLFAGLLGTALAALTTLTEWPGRRFFTWALVLPLALPVYVNAFVWARLLDYSGPLQGLARAQGLAIDRWLQIRSWPGAVWVLGLSLYPYVYLLARQAFLTQGRRSFEAARALGSSPWRAFVRVILPLSLPWILSGILLCAMEALADFGAVSILAVDTLSVGIYRTWQGLFAPLAAAQLATVIVVFIIFLNALKARTEQGRAYAGRSSEPPTPSSLPLSPLARRCATVFATCVLGLALLLPCGALALWALGPQTAGLAMESTWRALFNSLVIGALAALLACSMAFVLSTARRLEPSRWLAALARLSLLGYSLPGSVLAVAVFLPFAWIDRHAQKLAASFGWDLGLLLTGSLAALVIGQSLRFLALPLLSLESALKRLSPRLDEMAFSLGRTPASVLAHVHAPLLKRGIAVGALLVAVDVVKEMPMTLMMRPLGWDTLAVRIHQLSAEGLWNEAARPALLLLLLGFAPTWLLIRGLRSEVSKSA
jgi:iron(III) transport system permease protein